VTKLKIIGGLVPEDLIVGKAAFIWKSIDPFTEKNA
jgi:hypothetical protein